jgi:hypothetical protein
MLMLFTGGPHFKYQAGDWVRQNGIPQHHLRIVSCIPGVEDIHYYEVFDTTLECGYADYSVRQADLLEANSELVERAENDQHVALILARCKLLRHIKYSVPQRLDCESLQRLIQTGKEEDRWSPQVVAALGVGLASILFAILNQRSRKR